MRPARWQQTRERKAPGLAPQLPRNLPQRLQSQLLEPQAEDPCKKTKAPAGPPDERHTKTLVRQRQKSKSGLGAPRCETRRSSTVITNAQTPPSKKSLLQSGLQGDVGSLQREPCLHSVRLSARSEPGDIEAGCPPASLRLKPTPQFEARRTRAPCLQSSVFSRSLPPQREGPEGV